MKLLYETTSSSYETSTSYENTTSYESTSSSYETTTDVKLLHLAMKLLPAMKPANETTTSYGTTARY